MECFVRCYPNFEAIAEKLKKVPAPLRQKALEQLDERYEQLGFRCVGEGQDKNGKFLRVAIKPGTNIQRVYEFLNESDTAAVSVDPDDIERMWGKSPVSLAMQHNLEFNGASNLELLEPDQLAEALNTARIQTMNGSAVDADTDWFTTKLMVNEGMLSEAEVNAVDAWLEPEPQRMGLEYVGDPARRFTGEAGEDMAEFTPDRDLEAWEAGEI